VTRATTGQVYAQILSDLTAAESLMTLSGGGSSTHQATIGAVRAIRARVYLYQQNWAGAEAEAESVAALGYSLGVRTTPISSRRMARTRPRTSSSSSSHRWISSCSVTYYRAKRGGGWTARDRSDDDAAAAVFAGLHRRCVPSSYTPVDLRGQHNISFQGSTLYGSKWPTGIGGEDFPVIRFAEVLLIKAEAEAQQGKLAEADSSLDESARACRSGTARPGGVRATGGDHRDLARAAPGVWCSKVTAGPILIRTGRAVTTLAIPAVSAAVSDSAERGGRRAGLQQNNGY